MSPGSKLVPIIVLRTGLCIPNRSAICIPCRNSTAAENTNIAPQSHGQLIGTMILTRQYKTITTRTSPRYGLTNLSCTKTPMKISTPSSSANAAAYAIRHFAAVDISISPKTDLNIYPVQSTSILNQTIRIIRLFSFFA